MRYGKAKNLFGKWRQFEKKKTCTSIQSNFLKLQFPFFLFEINSWAKCTKLNTIFCFIGIKKKRQLLSIFLRFVCFGIKGWSREKKEMHFFLSISRNYRKYLRSYQRWIHMLYHINREEKSLRPKVQLHLKWS